jgi:nucleoid DNA-binding protein
MTKTKLIEIVAKNSHLTQRAAADAVDVFLDEIKRSLVKGEKVVLSGFGTFYLSKVNDKEVVPFGDQSKRQTIKGHRVVNFRVGRPLRKAVW